jgi:thiol-disulfide isomerase/thioredoxin
VYMKTILLFLVTFVISIFASPPKNSVPKELYLKINTEIPNFSSKNLNGEGRASTSILVDSNLNLVIDFAASWCIPCLQSIPALSKKVLELKDTRLIVIMTDKEWGEKQEEFIQKAGLSGIGVQVVWDKYGALKNRYKLGQALPVTYFFSQSKVIVVHEGIVESSFLNQLY